MVRAPACWLALAVAGVAVGVGSLAWGPRALHGYASSQAAREAALDADAHGGAGTFAYRAWVGGEAARRAGAPLAETWLKGYYFDVTNPLAVLRGAKPILAERGPYYFRWVKEQRDVVWRRDPDGRRRVAFRTYETFHLDANRSVVGAGIHDNVTTVNVAALALAALLRPLAADLGPEAEGIVAAVVDELQAAFPGGVEQMLFVNRTVSDLTFGYDDPLITRLLDAVPALAAVLPLGPGIPGLAGHTNMTAPPSETDPTSEVYAALPGDGDAPANYTQWKGYDHIECCASLPCARDTQQPIWPTEEQNAIRGSDGTMFGAGVPAPGSELSTWVEETNRTTILENVGGLRVDVGGVAALRYTVKHSEFISASINPANAKWYMYGPSGVLNVTRCSLGVPLFLSKPHFLDVHGAFNGTELGGGQEPLLSRVEGDVQPNRDEHDTRLDVEPLSGATLHGAQRLQANLWLAPQVLATGDERNVTLFGNCSPALMPIMWIEKGGAATDTALETLRSKLRTLSLARHVLLALGLLGCGAGFVGGATTMWRARRRRGDEAAGVANGGSLEEALLLQPGGGSPA